jgi:hypothetical protein
MFPPLFTLIICAVIVIYAISYAYALWQGFGAILAAIAMSLILISIGEAGLFGTFYG